MTAWKTIPDFSAYEASACGQVRNATTLRVMRPATTRKGYFSYGLSKNKRLHSISGHRLVWEAFRGKRKPGLQINHLDGDKKNNALVNLELVTASENVRHAFRIGLKCIVGEKHPRTQLKDADIRAIREARARGVKLTVLAERYGVNFSNISMIARRQTWKHVE